MKTLAAILIVVLHLTSSAQESGADSTSLSEVVKMFSGIDGPKVGVLAQFDAEVLTSNVAPRSSFNIHLLRMYLSGTIDEKLKYMYQGDFNGLYRTLDLKFSYLFDEHWKVDAGQFKVAFGREYLRNDAKLLFVNRSTVASTIGPLRQLGVQLSGKWFDQRLQLNTGVFNGEGIGSGANNISMITANANLVPILSGSETHQRLEVGGSIAYTSDEEDLYRVYSIGNQKILWSGNIRFEYQDYWIETEYNMLIIEKIRWEEGFYIDVAKRICDNTEVAFGIDYYSDIPIIDRKYIVGVNWYPLRHVKLQLNIVRNENRKSTLGILNFQYAINNEF